MSSRAGPSCPSPLLRWGIVAALLASSPSWALDRVVDRVAAIVNDEVIALSEVYELGSEYIGERCPRSEPGCVAEAESEIIEALVQRVLQRQELIRLGMDVTQAQVDQAINQIIADNGYADREQLRNEVEAAGFPWDLYRKQQVEEPLRERQFQDGVLRGRVTISDDELKDRYQRLIRDLEPPRIASLSAFGFVLAPDQPTDALVAAVTQVRAGLDAVRNGTRTWDAVVAEFDTAHLAPLFAGQEFLSADLNPSIAKVVFAAPPGSIPEPVVAGGVLYGLRVDAVRDGPLDVPPFDDVKDRLAEQVFVDKLQLASEDWFQVAQRRAAIRYLVGSKVTEAPGSKKSDDDATPAAPVDGAG